MKNLSAISNIKDVVTKEYVDSHNEIYIGDEQDAPQSTKLLIDEDDIDMLGSEVVNTLTGNETNKAPSVRAVKEDLNVYSTTEKRIGTWIDRKTFI